MQKGPRRLSGILRCAGVGMCAALSCVAPAFWGVGAFALEGRWEGKCHVLFMRGAPERHPKRTWRGEKAHCTKVGAMAI